MKGCHGILKERMMGWGGWVSLVDFMGCGISYQPRKKFITGGWFVIIHQLGIPIFKQYFTEGHIQWDTAEMVLEILVKFETHSMSDLDTVGFSWPFSGKATIQGEQWASFSIFQCGKVICKSGLPSLSTWGLKKWLQSNHWTLARFDWT